MDLADYFIAIFIVLVGALALGLCTGFCEWREKRKERLGK